MPVGSRHWEVPRAPAGITATTSRPVGPASPPSDLNLSGNSVYVVSTNLTVRNITLQGNAFLYVHGPSTAPPTLRVLGNVRVEGNSTFFVNSSTLTVAESYDVEWDILVNGTARFVTLAANLTSNGYQVGAAYEQQANVSLYDSVIDYTGWVDTDLVGGADLNLAYTWYSSDVVMFDNPILVSTAHFFAGYSAAFNVWLTFRTGTTGNISLPGPMQNQTWSFPGAASVSGIGYQVTLLSSYVLLFAVMLWQGSVLTVVNSPSVVMALDLDSGTVQLTGLREQHYAGFAIGSGLLDLHLYNTTVYTWNIYPFAGTADISQSAIGELQLFGAASASVRNSSLTGHGGYYGNQATGELSIANSTIHSQIVAYSGYTVLDNCTVSTTGTSRVLATGNGNLYSLDSSLSPHDSYQALGSGSIRVADTYHVNLTVGSAPSPGVQVEMAYATNGSGAASGTSDSVGAWHGVLLASLIDATGTNFVSYDGTAWAGNAAAVWSPPPATSPAYATIALRPLLAGSDPANGTLGVPWTTTALTLSFGFPMATVPTLGTVSATPAIGWTGSWDPTSQLLTLSLTAALLPSTNYTLTIGTAAVTEAGPAVEAPISIHFTTAALPPTAPAIASTDPADHATGVANDSNVSVTFSQPMNSSTLEAAFSITPRPAVGLFQFGLMEITWIPGTVLGANTTYTVTIAATATSAAGVPLGQPFRFSFQVAPAPAVKPIVPPGLHPVGSSAGLGAEILVGLIAFVVVIALLLLLARRRRSPPAPVTAWKASPPPSPSAPPSPAPPAPPPVAPPAAPWSEDDEALPK